MSLEIERTAEFLGSALFGVPRGRPLGTGAVLRSCFNVSAAQQGRRRSIGGPDIFTPWLKINECRGFP